MKLINTTHIQASNTIVIISVKICTANSVFHSRQTQAVYNTSRKIAFIFINSHWCISIVDFPLSCVEFIVFRCKFRISNEENILPRPHTQPMTYIECSILVNRSVWWRYTVHRVDASADDGRNGRQCEQCRKLKCINHGLKSDNNTIGAFDALCSVHTKWERLAFAFGVCRWKWWWHQRAYMTANHT